jgi:hypothetical protein
VAKREKRRPPSDRRNQNGTAGDYAATPDGIEARVRDRAYELYLERGGNDGDAVADWLRAERECREAQEMQLGTDGDAHQPST